MNHEEGRETLLARMDESLASLPLDFEGYEEKVSILSDFHQYLDGNYTIFHSTGAGSPGNRYKTAFPV
ncbi:MAG: hypothetical protein ACLTZM_08465 [Ruminococcus sp.]